VTAPIVPTDCTVCGRPGWARFDPPCVVHVSDGSACDLPPRVEPPKLGPYPRTVSHWEDPW
jgi:hypothetical protein